MVLAADLGARHGRLAVCDLAGVALAEREEPLVIADGPEPVLDWVGRTFDELLAEAGHARADVLAVAVGVPGPGRGRAGRPTRRSCRAGTATRSPTGLAERFGAPALLERDVNAMALGEHRRHWRDLSHMVFVKVATGIGAGIIAEGELLRGNHGRAGDIGHIRAHPAVRRHVHVRQPRLRRRAGDAPRRSSASSARRGSRSASTADVVELVRAGDAVAMHHVREAGRVLGAALAAVVSVGRAERDRGRRRAWPTPPSRCSPASARASTSARRRWPRASCGSSRAGSGRARAWSASPRVALEHVLEPANVDALLARRGLAA